MSAVTGPMMIGPRGVVSELVIDLVGSMIRVGAEDPETTRPEDEMMDAPAVDERARTGIEEAAVDVAADDDGRTGFRVAAAAGGGRGANQRDAAGMTKEPPDEVGQTKPDGAPVSLAQEWMPPRVCTPVMPAPTPDKAEAM